MYYKKVVSPQISVEWFGLNLSLLHQALILWFSWIQGNRKYCVKSVRIRSYSGLHFSHSFLHLDWIRRDTKYLSVFSPNAGKCGKNADQNNSEYDTVDRKIWNLIRITWIHGNLIYLEMSSSKTSVKSLPQLQE